MVRIITDSTSDIPKELQEKWNIDIIPLSVYFGDEVYKDGINLTHAEFYEKLATSEALPKTSMINPNEFSELFEKYIAAGDEIVCVTISSELSGTYQSAVLAKDMAESPNVYVVNSKTVTFALALLVSELVKMRDAGSSAAEIAKKAEELSEKVRLIAIVKTLKYLKLGGRISSTAAVVGTLLGISPLVAVLEGKVENIGKARGAERAFALTAEKLSEADLDESHPICYGHSNSPDSLKEFMNYFKDKVTLPIALTTEIGSTVGTYAGPDAVGIAYFVK